MVNAFSITADGHQTSLSPAEIDRELATMWKSEDEDAAAPSVTRVVLGNVLWLGERSQFSEALRLFQRVIPKYPCRLFLLVMDPADTSGEVRASVSAQCFRPDREKEPVCCEMIQLAFGPAALHHLRGCVAPLLIADLQTVLWRGAGSEGLEVDRLDQHVDHLITSASLCARPAAELRRLLAAGRPLVDLSWYRLAPIRDQVMAFFDDPNTGFDLRSIRRIRIQAVRCSKKGFLPEIMSSVFVGWIATCLGWRAGGVDGDVYTFRSGKDAIAVELKNHQGEGNAPTLSTVEMEDARGEVFHLALAPEGRSMEIYTGDCGDNARAVRCLAVSEMGQAEALGAAVNARRGTGEFGKVAVLALPLLAHLCGEAPGQT